jgi:hypothetical protein
MNKVVLVDGKNFGYIQTYAHKTLHSSTGFPTGMLHGGLVSLKKMVERTFPGAAIVFCWDGKGKTWRNDVPPHLYKANRGGDGSGELKPEVKDAFTQFPKFGLLLHGILKFKYLKYDHLEADDLIGLCTTVLRPNFEVVIVSSDQDFYQLVDPGVSVYSPRKDKLYTPKDVYDEFGVKPSRWDWFRALMGDSSDNLPGAPGLGPKKGKAALDAGLNPAIAFELNRRDVQAAYEKYREHWPIIQYCLKMSTIARKVGDLAGCLHPDVLDTIQKDLIQLLKFPYRGAYTKTEYKQLVAFMGEFELQDAMRDRNFWWSVK